MAQTYTINCYQADHVGQTDLAAMENNFEALRTTFSGTGTPPDMIAGMVWLDTANHLLKIRNEANSAWITIFDLVNYNIVTDLVSEFTGDNGVTIDGLNIKDGAITTSNSVPGAAFADNAVHLGKIQHGSVMLPVVDLGGTAISSSWVDMTNGTSDSKVYIPADATYVTMNCELKNFEAGQTAYCRFKIGSLSSSEISVVGTTWTWFSTCTLDVSSLSGWYLIVLEGKTTIGGSFPSVYVQNCSFMWE